MKLLLPALLIFLLAFLGLSLGILFKRPGISGTCSSASKDPRLADLKCTCGREDSDASCDNSPTIEVICPQQNPEQYRQLLARLNEPPQNSKNA